MRSSARARVAANVVWPRPAKADPLIKEARDRQWRRRRWIAAALALAAVASSAYLGFSRGSSGAGSPGTRPSVAEPAREPARDGWFVGSARVRTPGCAHCVQTASWASTIPYHDQPNDLPVRTMKALGAHDAIVQMSRSWQPREPAWALQSHPLRVERHHVHAGFEGNPTRNRVSEWATESWINGSNVEVYVWFGSPRPSIADVARVQVEINATRFPRWRRLR